MVLEKQRVITFFAISLAFLTLVMPNLKAEITRVFKLRTMSFSIHIITLFADSILLYPLNVLSDIMSNYLTISHFSSVSPTLFTRYAILWFRERTSLCLSPIFNLTVSISISSPVRHNSSFLDLTLFSLWNIFFSSHAHVPFPSKIGSVHQNVR